MRNNFILIAALIVAAFSSVVSYAADREWKDTPGGLPYYQYTGTADGDPAVLVGNSRIKVMSHLSGTYELISGERAWARFNADPVRPDYGKNRATVYFGNKATQLVGPGSLATKPGKCQMYTGAGFVRYDYDLGNDIKCSRMISVMPSLDPCGGEPLMLITLTFTNEGSSVKTISYDEAISPNFVQPEYQLLQASERPLRYHMTTEISFRCIQASFRPIPQGYATLSLPQSRAHYDSSPQSIFVYSDNAFLVVNEGELKASIDPFKVRPRKKHTFHIVIGFSGENDKETAEAAIAKAELTPYGAYSSMWEKHLPSFNAERNKDIRNELYRSAYMLEASAVYNDYFKEAFIPGDFLEAIRTGENMSNADHIQAALQACCTHPALAKSIIRYVMKQTSYDGMIPDANKGYGCIPSDSYSHNLVQLDVYNAVAEYLRRTGDYAFLDEWIAVYPMERGEMTTVRAVLQSYFVYLRGISYVTSQMSAMQASCLPKLVEQLEIYGKMPAEFMTAIRKYTDDAMAAIKDISSASASELPYILESDVVSTSVKRDLAETAMYNATADMRAVSGLASFDGIEASSLFYSLMQKNRASDHPDVMDAWAIYSYFRLLE